MGTCGTVRVIIAGSRGFTDYEYLKRRVAFRLLPLAESHIEIVSGGAKGADRLGERYAAEIGLGLKVFPANWGLHGNRAGYLRNREMSEYATHLIAFWDGESKGTKHMIDLAREKGLTVWVERTDIPVEEECEMIKAEQSRLRLIAVAMEGYLAEDNVTEVVETYLHYSDGMVRIIKDSEGGKSEGRVVRYEDLEPHWQKRLVIQEHDPYR